MLTEKEKQYKKEYRKNHSDLKDKEAYNYFMNHGETIQEYRKRYNLNNKNKTKINRLNWETKNKEKSLLLRKEYWANNRLKYNKIRSIRLDAERFGGNRQLVLERDCFQCQECGLNNEQHIVIYGVGLHIHHIDENKQNNVLTNLKTLCVKCHRFTFDTSLNARGKTNE